MMSFLCESVYFILFYFILILFFKLYIIVLVLREGGKICVFYFVHLKIIFRKVIYRPLQTNKGVHGPPKMKT